MNTVSIKNWRQYQHYRDRDPKWIKLHQSLLDDEEFAALKMSAQLLYFKLLLIAARKDNCIPVDTAWLSRELNLTRSTVMRALKMLTESGFLVDSAANPASTNASATRARREKEQEKKNQRKTKTIAAPTAAAKNARRGKRKDEEFEAIIEVCGADSSALTPSARGAINRALKDLRSVGATADEIRARAAEYRKRFNMPLTASALAKHWPTLRDAAGKDEHGFSAYNF